jgi:hypothetical protein
MELDGSDGFAVDDGEIGFDAGNPGLRENLFWIKSLQVIQRASRTIFGDILEVPKYRSVKMMGISTIVKPSRQIRWVISIWKLYPLE